MSELAEARPAATVVLLRGESPFEVFFVRRHGKAAFMANAYVFPGGRVDAADAHPEALDRLVGVDLGALAGRMEGMAGPEAAGAHLVAAIRETFEEAGILLARHDDGRPLDPADADLSERLAAWRGRVHAGEATLAQLAEAERLTLDAASLGYFAHWVTPVVEKRRFDARFFVARAPAGQAGRHDTVETTDSCWLTPADALEAYTRGGPRGGFTLAPPTWQILRDLAALPDAAAALQAPERVPCLTPHFTQVDGALVLALPGDPLHPSSPVALAGVRRRIVLVDGRWTEG